MNIQKSDIVHIADLSKLRLDEAEIAAFTQEIDVILKYVETLAAVDTDGIEETNQVTGLHTITRKDEVLEYPKEKQALLLAQAHANGKNYIPIPHLVK